MPGPPLAVTNLSRQTMKPFQPFTSRGAAAGAILGLLVASQGFAALAGPGYGWRYPAGHYRGYRGSYYRPGGWYGGWYGGWRPGFFLSALPFGYLSLTFAGAPWYYGDGYWYRAYDDGYIVDLPPAGIQVPSLPPGCASHPYSGTIYYSANGVWYKADPGGGGYVVCAPPPGREAPAAQPAPGTPEDAGLAPLILIPRKGQTEEQMLADRRV